MHEKNSILENLFSNPLPDVPLKKKFMVVWRHHMNRRKNDFLQSFLDFFFKFPFEV